MYLLAGVLKKHSAKYYFKHVLNAEFGANAECPMFMDYIETITQRDKELKKLIQVVIMIGTTGSFKTSMVTVVFNPLGITNASLKI